MSTVNRILLARGPSGSNLDKLFDVKANNGAQNEVILKDDYDISANVANEASKKIVEKAIIRATLVETLVTATYIGQIYIRTDTNQAWIATSLLPTVWTQINISDALSNVPTALSELANDTNFITAADVAAASGVPTALSQLTNDTNFITTADVPGAAGVPTLLSQLTNDTAYVTQTAINTAVTDLINGAPATLNTLKELSSAIGDDPSFITNIENSIATKLSIANAAATYATIASLPTNVSTFVNDSAYVTQSEIDTSISNLVDSSPATLNTLNELAAALGDDANFSTTVTNSIATKAPIANPTFTGTVSGPDLSFDNLQLTNALPIAQGGTGSTTTSAARSSLGLAIGTDVQAYDAQLADIAGLTPSDGKIIIGDGNNFITESGPTARSSLGLAIGSDVQAYDAQLADIAGLTPNDGNIIVGDGSNFVTESGATARSSLGLAIGTNVQAYHARLADIAGLTPTDGNIIIGDGSNFVTESGATARSSLGLVIGTNVQAYHVRLADIAGLTPTDGNIIVGNGSNFVAESGGTARASLGLTIGSDVQAYNADLAAIAGLTSAADKGIQFTGSGTAATYNLTAAGKALLDDADATAQRATLGLGSLATESSINNSNWSGADLAVANGGTGASNAGDARTNLGLVIGTNVQAYHARLGDIAGLTPTDGNIIIGNGNNFVTESGSTARDSLGLGNVDNTSDVNKPVSTLQQAAIDAAIANLISSAPTALNTLNELAAALGDDENFSTTITNSIATNTTNISSNDTDITNIKAKTDHITVTQAVDLDTMESSITTNATNISSNDTDITNIKAKTDHITVTQAVDLDTMESNIATNATNISSINSNNTDITNIKAKTDHITVTQAVDLDTMESSITTNATNITSNDTDITNIKAKTDHITVTQAVDLDTMESNIATNATNISSNDTDITNIKAKTDHITVTQAVDLDTMESSIATNATNISSNDTDITNLTNSLATKLSSADAATTYAPLANPTFNGATTTFDCSQVILPAQLDNITKFKSQPVGPGNSIYYANIYFSGASGNANITLPEEGGILARLQDLNTATYANILAGAITTADIKTTGDISGNDVSFNNLQLSNTTADQNALIVDGSANVTGNVGIGTDSPNEKLVVQDISNTYIKVVNSAINNAAGIKFVDNHASSNYGGDTYADWAIETGVAYDGGSNEAMYFRKGHSSSIYDKDNVLVLRHDTGNIGIGTSTPLHKLDIKGVSSSTSNAPNIRFTDTNDGNARNWKIGPLESGNDGFQINPSITNGGDAFHTKKFFVRWDGRVGIGTDTPGYTLEVVGSLHSSGASTSSDDRIKHNETNITNALETIKQLQPKKYIKTIELYDANHNFTLDSSGNPLDESGNVVEHIIETGLIAQEVKQVAELSPFISGEETDASGVPTALGLNYNSIFCYSIEAIKELEEKNRLLTEKVEVLEKKLEDEKTRVDNLYSHLGL